MRGDRKSMIQVSLIFIAMVGVYFLFYDRTLQFYLQARRGQPIVQALEQYRHVMGHYPESLTDLVPTYLAQRTELLHPWEGLQETAQAGFGVGRHQRPSGLTRSSQSGTRIDEHRPSIVPFGAHGVNRERKRQRHPGYAQAISWSAIPSGGPHISRPRLPDSRSAPTTFPPHPSILRLDSL